MSASEIVSDLIIFFSSALKFAFGSFAVIVGNMGVDGTIANVAGAILGIYFFVNFGDFLKHKLVEKYPNRFGHKFNYSTRLLVKIKHGIGLRGLALITPVFLSIPVGVSLALILTSNKQKIYVNMIASTLFWSAIFFVPYFVFHIDIYSYLKTLIGF